MAQAVSSLAEAASHNVPSDVFLKHYREIRGLKDAAKDASAAVARAKKAAKNAGIDLDALKLVEKLAELDTDEAELQLRHLKVYAQWIQLPIGMQLNMFGEPEAATLSAQQAQEQREFNAAEQGKQAGTAGHEKDDNPYDAGTGEFDAWERAWAIGNKVWLRGQKQLAGELAANANGKQRGRPAAEH